MVKVCLIEDESSLSDLIRLNLEMEGFEITVFTSGGDAFRSASKMMGFQLVILDIMLPEKSGLDICREIRKYSEVPVLFISAKGTSEDRIAGLKLGANDYLSKPFDLEELILRVHVLTRQQLKTKQAIVVLLRIGNKEINFDTFEIKNLDTAEVITLSKKEIDLLRLFSDQENRVISRDEILDKVWGTDQFPTSRTIDNYILSFRKQFEPNPREPIYFHSVRAVGYKFTNHLDPK